VPTGSTVTTSGPCASAILFYPNGTNVALTEDSAVTLGPTDDRLRLERGVIAADVRPPLVGGRALTLATAETVLSGTAGAIVTLYQAASITEVGVQLGKVSVTAPRGAALGEVDKGEILTVHSENDFQKQKIPGTPSAFDLDLRRPLPVGWAVGSRNPNHAPPVLETTYWHDPYYGKEMYQIRSNHSWARGFFRLLPDSLVTVRYKVDDPGPGQVCFCVRTPDASSPDTGMLEWNGEYGDHPLDQDGWRTLRVHAGEMLGRENKHKPNFSDPWIGFLFIFNTYQRKLNLKIAEFRVTPPAGAAPD
jgi:hypothetical protein